MAPEQPGALDESSSRDPDRPPAALAAAVATSPFVVFRVLSTWYACAAEVLQRIEAAREPVPVPGTPRFLRGVLQSGGRIVCVIDPALLLGVSSPAPARSEAPPRLLVLTAQGLPVGLAVDEVAGLIPVPTSSVIRLDGPLPAIGRFPLDGRVVTILDASELLQLAEDQVGDDDDAADGRAG